MGAEKINAVMMPSGIHPNWHAVKVLDEKSRIAFTNAWFARDVKPSLIISQHSDNPHLFTESTPQVPIPVPASLLRTESRQNAELLERTADPRILTHYEYVDWSFALLRLGIPFAYEWNEVELPWYIKDQLRDKTFEPGLIIRHHKADWLVVALYGRPAEHGQHLREPTYNQPIRVNTLIGPCTLTTVDPRFVDLSC